MLAMHDIIDDSLLKSREIIVDIGYASRETKPDWPLVRHKMLHVKNECPFYLSLQKSQLETLNLQ